MMKFLNYTCICNSHRSCPSLFDETQMFNDDSSAELKEQFKQHFRNISRIMDCVGCEKCRLWGKLQVINCSIKSKSNSKFNL